MKLSFIIKLVLVVSLLSLTACGSTTPPEEIALTEEAPNAGVTEAAPTPVSEATIAISTATPIGEATPVSKATPTVSKAAPTATPASGSKATPSPTPFIYVVEKYDTILGIAIEFDTTTEAILSANGINENDFLQIGQELVIPKDEGGGRKDENDTEAAPTEETTEGSTEEPANQPTEEASPPSQSPISDSQPPSPVSEATEAAPGGPPPPTISHPDNINPLTGLPVDDPAVLQRRPLFVRIGNDVAARPQVGLNSADIVYEEITEWWVTRFTAVYLSQTPTTVAPIRSARLSNVQMVPQYQGALAHSGGSDAVRWEISQAPIANLDEFYNPQPYFYRPNEGWQTRLAINTQAAREYMEANNLEAPVALQGFLFSDSINNGDPAENIFIAYPRATSFTQWRYDAAGGQYLRFVDDVALLDFADGQVSADNVIIYFAEHDETDIVEDSNGMTSIRIIVNGRGPAWFFRDGMLNKGYWETDGSRTPYFAYEDGSPYHLKPGRTWIELVPTYFTIGLNSPDEASSRP